jgi:hypothetical protein
MFELVLRSLVLVAGAALWLAGLRLFLRAGLSRARRLVLLRSGRGLSFWIRACGFELGTVFGVAALTRLLCDQAGLRALLGTG